MKFVVRKGSGILTMYHAQPAGGQPTYQAPPVYLAPPVSRVPSLYGSHPQFYNQGSMPSQVIYSSGPSEAIRSTRTVAQEKALRLKH